MTWDGASCRVHQSLKIMKSSRFYVSHMATQPHRIQVSLVTKIIGAKIEGHEMLRAPSGGNSKTLNLSLDRVISVNTGGAALIAQILRQTAK